MKTATRIKIFTGGNLNRLEKEVNDFIFALEVEIVQDVRLTENANSWTILLIYSEEV